MAQRILESTCRLCNQPGHWKAECPMRQKGTSTSANSSSGSAAFAGVAMTYDSFAARAENQEADLDDAPPSHATPLVVEETCLMLHDNPRVINGDKWERKRDNRESWKTMLIHRLQAVLRKTSDRMPTEKPLSHNPLRTSSVGTERSQAHELRRDGSFCIAWNTWHSGSRSQPFSDR